MGRPSGQVPDVSPQDHENRCTDIRDSRGHIGPRVTSRPDARGRDGRRRAGEVWAAGHEQVVFCHDRPTGLRAIIAIYSTALGPALGGTRFHPYPTTAAALADVLALSEAMAYKNALAGLDHGGGKAVIIGDPRTAKTEAAPAGLRPVRGLARRPLRDRLRRRHLRAGHGRRRPGEPLRHRPQRGRPAAPATPSVLTAYGVFQGLRAAAATRWGAPTPGRAHASASAASARSGATSSRCWWRPARAVVVTDVDAAAVAAIREPVPAGARRRRHRRAARAEPLDAWSPCAMGGA